MSTQNTETPEQALYIPQNILDYVVTLHGASFNVFQTYFACKFLFGANFVPSNESITRICQATGRSHNTIKSHIALALKQGLFYSKYSRVHIAGKHKLYTILQLNSSSCPKAYRIRLSSLPHLRTIALSGYCHFYINQQRFQAKQQKKTIYKIAPSRVYAKRPETIEDAFMRALSQTSSSSSSCVISKKPGAAHEAENNNSRGTRKRTLTVIDSDLNYEAVSVSKMASQIQRSKTTAFRWKKLAKAMQFLGAEGMCRVIAPLSQIPHRKAFLASQYAELYHKVFVGEHGGELCWMERLTDRIGVNLKELQLTEYHDHFKK